MEKFWQKLSSPRPYDFDSRMASKAIKILGTAMIFLVVGSATQVLGTMTARIFMTALVMVILAIYIRVAMGIISEKEDIKTEFIRRFEGSMAARRYQAEVQSD